MSITWLLEKNLWDESLSIERACNTLGYKVKWLEYIPFSNLDFSNIQPEGETYIFHGSLNLAKKLRPHVKGVYCDLKQFECTTYYNYLGQFLLNDEYFMFPFGEVKRNYRLIFELLERHSGFIPTYAKAFIRPNKGDKLFTGQLIEYERFDKDFENLNYHDIDASEIVVFSYPKIIDMEYRFIICDKQIIGNSVYRYRGELASFSLSRQQDPVLFDYVERIANTWQPEPIFAIDIAKTPHGYKLLEINSFSCSGLYDADILNIVQKVSEFTLKENSYED